MKRQMKSPRILKIIKNENFTIDLAFRNGEVKRVDFTKILKEVSEENPLYQLRDSEVFDSCVVNESGIITWGKTSVKVEIPGLPESVTSVEMDPEMLYELGDESPLNKPLQFGSEIREIRVSKKMTLAQLSNLCGISESELSRVENNKNIELDTLRRIYQFGFDMELVISGKKIKENHSSRNYRKSKARILKILKSRNW
jgi:predicted transcriptional regulator